MTSSHLAGALIDEWAPSALSDPNVLELTISRADDDQGAFARRPDPQGCSPNWDALIDLGVKRGHDLDDVPDRDALHRLARRIELWRVNTSEPKSWDRTWPDGVEAPGIKQVSLMKRAEGLSHVDFARHWTQHHTPLALRHHVGLWNYRQHVVRRALTPGGRDIDGIAELHFRSRDDLETKFFDSDEGVRVILADVDRFMRDVGRSTVLMRETPLRTAR